MRHVRTANLCLPRKLATALLSISSDSTASNGLSIQTAQRSQTDHCAATHSGWVLVACEQFRNHITAIQSPSRHPRVQESGSIVSLPIPALYPTMLNVLPYPAPTAERLHFSDQAILCCSAKALLTRLGQSATQRSGFSDFKPASTATTPSCAELAAAPAGAPASAVQGSEIASSHAYENSRNFT